MAEFTSLNGFMVKDATARNIAKGRNQAVAFVDYATMIETLNEFEKDEYKAGQNVYIGVVGVPDLWVYSVEDIRHTFEYVSDEEIVDKLKTYTTIQVGFFKLAMLEGQKVDLTTYDQILAEHTDDIAEINAEIDGINDSIGHDGEIGDGIMTVHDKLDVILGNTTISSYKTHKIVKAHLNSAVGITIDGLTIGKRYKMVVLRGNVNSDPTCLIQEATISTYKNCELEKINYGFYFCTPTEEEITVNVASVNGGGYFYNAICYIFE